MTNLTRRRIILAGGSGFMGSRLLPELLPRYDEVVVLTRGEAGKPSGNAAVRHVQWDAHTACAWVRELDGAEAIINLVGRSVDCRKTPENRRVILQSRVDSVRALAEGWRLAADPPKFWIQTGTAHIFGDAADEVLDDSSPPGIGFAPDVGRTWELAFAEADVPGCRKVLLRISFVLGREGGALRTLGRLARLGLGGTVGSGRQYFSWIHSGDLNAIFLRALADRSMQGPNVVTAPNPVTNRDFMRMLRRAVRRPWSPPIPAPLVRLGSWLMRTDPELALLGRRCVPTRLLREGFQFRFPELQPALDDLLSPLKI